MVNDVAWSDEDLAWVRLRTAYWQERVDLDGQEDDYLALTRAFLQAHLAGDDLALTGCLSLLSAAATRYPRSVSVWEYRAYVASLALDQEALEDALAVVERLDPTSWILTEAERLGGRTTPGAPSPLELAASQDDHVREAALVELERVARDAPHDSTHAGNYALGLMAAGHTAKAREVAYAARGIEDGSFADAYNIGLVLTCTGAAADGRALLQLAAQRAESDEELELVEDMMTRVTNDAG